ncbi:MAG: VOC family protein [Pseudomonadota bacterium]
MLKKILAIHVAVNSVEEAAKTYTRNFGIEPFDSGSAPELGIKNVLFRVGDTVIELIEPYEAGEGPVAKFLEKRGEGVYMTAMGVDDLDSAASDLRSKGVPLINDTSEAREQGTPVFVHPKATHGLMIELLETSDE